MKYCRTVLLLFVSLFSASALADASAGIFVILDEVQLEPSDIEPDRIRLRGVFVVPRPVSSGLHLPPRHGELYFSLNADEPEATRADWQALHAAAGTGDVVAFGQYWMPADREAMLAGLPEAMRESMTPASSSFNTSLVVTLHTDSSPVLAEPYPTPNSRGVIESFDSEEQLCPRFGASASEIVASLWQAHDPDQPRPPLPFCEARVGLIDGSDLDTAFEEQERDEAWAAGVEALLNERVADSGVELTALSIECRFTICHLAFAFPPGDYWRSVGIELTNAVVRDVPGFVNGSKVEDSRTDAPTRDYWIQRRMPQ